MKIYLKEKVITKSYDNYSVEELLDFSSTVTVIKDMECFLGQLMDLRQKEVDVINN